ncbi:cellulose synthase catalytic subunit [Methylobacterium sp. 17Sr1-1]|uniref:glycosyltransferase family 2 protein n=1 Tax=Methylobacterium sp. 17Sr1-1 TaxID=2202826 RepID=UPI000D6FDE06|nr:cellulose synthase catalytic subunit [Methylobacterium sp. 17Sr1-1]AWN52756.1 cellulose synthase [Methylobacterium sp. 17Sr1-1]
MFGTPGDVSTVLALNLAVALALYALPALLVPQRAYDRWVFGGLTAALVVTYVAWRWTDTLPPLELSAEALWPYLFFIFEAVAITYTLMSIAILMRHKDRSAEADLAQARHEAANDWPAVDVFICTYNEPLEVLEKSILPALAIDYPHKTVWVLDDTRRDWLRDYCEKVGARYLRRPDNKGAKAGNLNNGLRATAAETGAPLILVLDADFAPQPDILTRMVGLFDDPRAAVVQSPQFFFNADPIQHNLSAAESWVDDQRIFFDVFQPAKDAWGCSFCVGTSFIVRRDRLDEIGGFPDAAICEDLNLSCGMMRAGYRTHWLNERLSMGLSAEGLPEYITQRTRWCLGTMQVALLRSGPLFGSGYTLIQRLHFVHGVLNWLCKPFIVLMLIAPSIYWFAGLPAFQADYLSFLRFGLPMLLAVWAYNGWISGSRTLPLFMEVTHTMTALPITVTLAVAAVKPFGRPFKVTDKGGDRSRMMVRWRLAALFGGFSLLSAFSIVWAFVAPEAATEVSSMDYFNLVWAGVAMVLTFVAFLVCFEYPRADLLFPCALDAVLEADGCSVPARVTHLSTDRATLAPDVAIPAGAVLHLPGIGPVPVAPLGEGLVRLDPDFARRRALVLMLYGTPRDRIARQARLSGAMAGLVRRGFGLS